VALADELADLDELARGWRMSLGKPRLAESVREMMEADLARAAGRQAEIKRLMATRAAADGLAREALDPGAVADRLNHLADVLARQNPTRCNIELAAHIQGIHCHPDGSVVVRTCKLGSLTGATELLADGSAGGPGPWPARRLAVRRLTGPDADQPAVADLAELATDAGRFAGLGPEWFWDDAFRPPAPACWSRTNAAAVGAARKENKSEEELAAMFGVTVPTIRAALNIARESDPELAALPRKRARRRWEDEHYLEVHAMVEDEVPIREVALRFKKSPTTILKAVKLFNEKAGTEPPSEAMNGDQPA
jgi:transposase